MSGNTYVRAPVQAPCHFQGLHFFPEDFTMARGINKVILIGNLGADPETRAMPSGSTVANLRIATSESWRDKQTGEQQERTEWHRVALFGRLAEVAGEYLKKGSQVYIEGSLRTRKWTDKQGQERYSTEIIGNELQMLGGRAGGGGGAGGRRRGRRRCILRRRRLTTGLRRGVRRRWHARRGLRRRHPVLGSRFSQQRWAGETDITGLFLAGALPRRWRAAMRGTLTPEARAVRPGAQRSGE